MRIYRKNALIMAFSLPAKVWNQKGYSSLKTEDSPLTPCECLFPCIELLLVSLLLTGPKHLESLSAGFGGGRSAGALLVSSSLSQPLLCGQLDFAVKFW